MEEGAYGYIKDLPGVSFEEARNRVTEALGEEGFGVLTTIEVDATLKKKLDVDFKPYVILGACNPVLAHRALEAEPQIGLLLPCNVVVEAAGDGSRVMVIKPRAMFQVVDNPALEPIAQEADDRLRRALEKLA